MSAIPYTRLSQATPEEKVDIVLELIEQKGWLELPATGGNGADLSQIDFSIQALQKRIDRLSGSSATWWDAVFNKVNLCSAELQGANLREAKLQGVVLWHAKLQQAELEHAQLEGADLMGAELQRAKMACVNLKGAKLTSANLEGADLSSAHLEGVNLSEAVIRHIYMCGAFLDKTKLFHTQLGGAIGEEREGKDYELARQGYITLKRNFEDIGDHTAASWAYCRERRMEKATKTPWRCRKYHGDEVVFPLVARLLARRSLSNSPQYGSGATVGNVAQDAFSHCDQDYLLDDQYIKYNHLPRRSPIVWWFWLKYSFRYILDLIAQFLCDYGESVGLVLFWLGVILFGFAAYYWHIGGVWLTDLSSGNQITATSFFPHYLIYSAGAMTTMDFSTLQAADDRVRLITAFQAVLGIFLAGLLGFVVGNRIRRS